MIMFIEISTSLASTFEFSEEMDSIARVALVKNLSLWYLHKDNIIQTIFGALFQLSTQMSFGNNLARKRCTLHSSLSHWRLVASSFFRWYGIDGTAEGYSLHVFLPSSPFCTAHSLHKNGIRNEQVIAWKGNSYERNDLNFILKLAFWMTV